MDQNSKTVQELFTSVETEVKAIVQTKFNLPDMVKIIKLSIETVEKLKKSDTQKVELCKQLLLFILDDLAKQNLISSTEKTDIETALNIIMPVIYDLVLLVYNNGLNLSSASCFKCKKCKK